jgi:hypothetical protein
MKQYVTNPFKMAECAQWRTWDRDRFCSELLSAVPDIAVVRPESAANFVEQMAQVVIRRDLSDPFVEKNLDNVISIRSRVSLGAANTIDRAAAGNSISLRKTLERVSVNSAI